MQNRYVEWGAGMPDLDNDGRPDLFYVTGNVYPEIEALLPQYPHRGPRIVFRNLGDGRFEDVTDRSGPGATAPHSSRGAAFGDFDNDGDLDVLVMNMNEPPSLLRNDYDGGNGWIEVRLEGTRSNRAGDRRDGDRDRGRAPAGAGRAQPVELLLARRPAAALRPRRGARAPSASRCAGRAGRWTCCTTLPAGRLVTTVARGEAPAARARPRPASARRYARSRRRSLAKAEIVALDPSGWSRTIEAMRHELLQRSL